MNIYLIPSHLSDNGDAFVTPFVREVIPSIHYFLVEEERTARRFVGSLKLGIVVRELVFFKVNKQTKSEQIARFFEQIPKGSNVGVLSEAGVPCVADPGSLVVDFAHRKKWNLFPLPGASSILLALMGSGMNGQKFTFNGYLPIKAPEATKSLKQIQAEAQKGCTQLFMETPYRNNKLLEWILATCHKELKLCIACNLTAPDQFIRTRKVGDWKVTDIDLHKKPTIFVLGA